MTDWIALLRGVNVGGITIRSAELQSLFVGLGYDDVRTVVASGNVVFHSGDAVTMRAALKKRIEEALRDRFGYDAWILLVTRAELERVVEKFPFDDTDATRQPYAIFCVDEDTRDELVAAAASLDTSADPVKPGPGAVYWNPEKGMTLHTEFAKVLGRKTYKARTTNRNLRTLRKILG